jgi:hypothetical protein
MRWAEVRRWADEKESVLISAPDGVLLRSLALKNSYS